MTAKRFHKLVRSEMTKWLPHSRDITRLTRTPAHGYFFGPNSTYHSYQEMWNSVRAILFMMATFLLSSKLLET